MGGWVYEAERGRSFDGQEIEAFVRMPLNHIGDPTRDKKFYRADLHLDLESRVTLGISAIFDDGNAPDQTNTDQIVYGGGGLWDEGLWDEFYWDAPLNGYATFDLIGTGRNISVLILSKTKLEAPHTLNGITLHFAPRKMVR